MPAISNLQKKPHGTGHRYESGGQNVPSVTTILNAINKPGLPYWASKVSLQAFMKLMAEGADLTEAYELARKAPNKERDEAAALGTYIHSVVESRLKTQMEFPPTKDGMPVIEPFPQYHGPLQREARTAEASVERFFDLYMPDGSYEVVALESVVGLQDGSVRFAGTVDSVILFKESQEVAVIDWKTSSGLYPEAAMQVSAYAEAWGHANQDWLAKNTKTGNVQGWVVRFMKKGRQDPEVKIVDREEAYRAFCAAHTLYVAIKGETVYA